MYPPLSPRPDPVVPLESIRSALFVPALQPELFAKALSTPADAVIIDLEDSVPLANLALIPVIETPLGLENAYQLLAQTLEDFPGRTRLRTAAFGAHTFCAEMGVDLTGTSSILAFPRVRLAVACRAAGMEGPLDSPYTLRIKDTEALKSEAEWSRELGFQGKLCVSPLQVETVNRVFHPTRNEIHQAKRIIEAYEMAEDEAWRAAEVDGRMIRKTMVVQARRVIQRSRL